MEPRENLWNTFEQTGRVDAYLEYKNTREADLAQLSKAEGDRRTDETQDRSHSPPGLQAGG